MMICRDLLSNRKVTILKIADLIFTYKNVLETSMVTFNKNGFLMATTQDD